jgi:type IX secretion system PorP/SprF family membrane protein
MFIPTLKQGSLPSAIQKNNQTLMRPLLLIAFLFCRHVGEICAQDLHYSQFYHNPMHLNPGSTGIFRGDLRASALYRTQWNAVPVAYQSFAGALDWKAMRRKNSLISAGFLLQHDQAGDAGLTWTQVGTTVGVAHALGTRHAISAGFGIALAQRQFDIGGLTFKNQWGGDFFDPALPTKEFFGQQSKFFPSLSAGANWLYEPGQNRNRAQLGLALFHLNRPVASFLDDAAQALPMRLTLHALLQFEISQTLDIMVVSAFQHMARARETLLGGGLRQLLRASPDKRKETHLQALLSLRQKDALIPSVQVERGSWTLGLSYDWNISPFQTATLNRGGLEIALVYRSLPVPPPKAFKACPIF